MSMVNGHMSSMSRPFYITTTLPYVNADPHIGFAFELVSADMIARHKKLTGHEVFFNTGTDEYGVKVYRRAQEEGKEIQRYVDEYAGKYRELLCSLGILEEVRFLRTTDPAHKKAAQELWRRCAASGDIYKKFYRVKYCVGCELEKTESELVDGRCSVHPNLNLEIIEEENYFFRLSKYQGKLRELWSRPDFVIPDSRLNELRSLAERQGLEDFSISRLASKMPWGVPVPDDAAHVFYVWFDALVSYLSTLGWPNDGASFQKWWVESGGVVQCAGKDQIRQQAAMWQAMLLSAGLPSSKQIVIHGFITSEGEKMSKSQGNVVDPFMLVREYGTDAVRWYLARHIHPFEDSDFTLAKFKEAYNADLANGIGNLVSRIMKMSNTNIRIETHQRIATNKKETEEYPEIYKKAFEQYNIQGVAEYLSQEISRLDRRIQETEPFKRVKQDREAGAALMRELVSELSLIACMLTPILPGTSRRIEELIQANKMPSEPLFPRKY
ncbi:MAG: methionyl-tRNA synthetase [Parcubacteria group bacterium Greene0416_79]|nr:MAG: methionyl-tRNA synthetase [Parcubacteria group bacterium Greene0416_79]